MQNMIIHILHGWQYSMYIKTNLQQEVKCFSALDIIYLFIYIVLRQVISYYIIVFSLSLRTTKHKTRRLFLIQVY